MPYPQRQSTLVRWSIGFLLCSNLGVESAPAFGDSGLEALFGRAVGDQCKAPEGSGTCINKASCKGIAYPAGLCPNDPAEIQCCVVISCKSAAGSGFCRSVSNNGCSGGKFVTNACPGNDDIRCCIDTTPATSSAAPTPTAAPPSPKWPSCRTTLSCPYSEIEQTSLQDRLEYVRYMQSTHFGPLNAGNQFRAIEGVIIFFQNKGLGAPGTWVSYVDAGIVEAIQRGGAMALGLSTLDGNNPGSAKWADFLRKMKAGSLGDRDSHDYAWSVSEQQATEYGRSRADALRLPATAQTLRWYKFTQLFRWIMRNRELVIQSIKDNAPFPVGFILSKSAEAIINWLTDITNDKPTICGSDACWDLSELDQIPVSSSGVLADTGILIKVAFKLAVCLGLG